LIYLAIKFLIRKISATIDKTFGILSTLNLLKDKFISALFSPVAIVFFVVIFPTFLNSNNNFILHLIILMTTYANLDFFLTIYAGISSRIAIYLKKNPNLISRLLSRLSGCALLFLAYKILITKINL
jgi:threonine/homoserine/homoserine lactone efflux protein